MSGNSKQRRTYRRLCDPWGWKYHGPRRSFADGMKVRYADAIPSLVPTLTLEMLLKAMSIAERPDCDVRIKKIPGGL